MELLLCVTFPTTFPLPSKKKRLMPYTFPPKLAGLLPKPEEPLDPVLDVVPVLEVPVVEVEPVLEVLPVEPVVPVLEPVVVVAMEPEVELLPVEEVEPVVLLVPVPVVVDPVDPGFRALVIPKLVICPLYVPIRY